MSARDLARDARPQSCHISRMKPESDQAFGVYIHWPFCLSKCPYCDFNSHVRHAAFDEPRFARSLGLPLLICAVVPITTRECG